ncbi:ABC transporter permease [Parapusillimonas granuli]|uniref:ABC transporter permease n=1 Tax=Parapusillimonas granuli TaxID=380911 RepID=UPI0017AC25DC|nr:ABC transporter permease [Parapusillimonas granuli]MBB5215532.1 peptide/nickel transport system permease protein [Parapusillimonas granuli]
MATMALRRLTSDRFPVIPLLMVAATVLAAVFADYLVLHDPLAINPGARLLPPVFAGGSWDYPLGTDRLGRDIFSRIILGAQVSLGVAVTTIMLGGFVGTLLGLVAGYRGGWIDALIMRSADGFLAFPSILLALVLAVTVGPSFMVVVVVLALVLWARFARLVRGEVLSIKGRDYVLLARVAGAGGLYIVLRHILPNILNTLVVLCTLQVGWAIIVEASLTFLGAGVPPPTPTWGGMVAEGLDYIESAWWISVMPGVAILFVVFSYNLVGDWLRDILDPQLRNI